MAVLNNVLKWLKERRNLDIQLLREAHAAAWDDDDEAMAQLARKDEAIVHPTPAGVGVCVVILAGLIAKEVKRWKPDLITDSTSPADWTETARKIFDGDRA